MNDTAKLTAAQLADALHQFAPPQLAESYDNVGLLVGEADTPVQAALLALELTPAVLDEAQALGCQAVITHHPIWFGKRFNLRGDDYPSRLILRAIRQNIALIAVHTNLDAVLPGVNARMGAALGLRNLSILQPNPRDPQTGAGQIGTLPQPLAVPDFLALLKQAFGTGVIRYAPAPHIEAVHKVAICGGAGSFLRDAALRAGAHAFVTGDITHHHFFDPDGRMLLCDIGHYESEQYTPEILHSILTRNFPNFAFYKSAVVTNPVAYFV